VRPHLALALAAAILAACGASPSVEPGAGGDFSAEPAGLASIVAAHDQVRAGVGVGPLTWDAALARTAAVWAAQCRDNGSGFIPHNPDRSVGSAVYVGENIYASTAAPGAVTGPQAVAAWASEAADYDYASNTCAAGQVCGHYTQVVWRSTTRVGCAKQDCPALTYRTNVICDYAPGGNVSGQKPY
jgi:pathogenesis-related protein 1